MGEKIIFNTQPKDYLFKYFFTERSNPIMMFRREIKGLNNTWRMNQWRGWS